ncbi:MAG: hypothetical protein DI585_06920 [Pseudomonas fluorescens]|nr:MAG: hypothetical protein DI585_06920 [Pseudomonas fluorescens]
MSSTHNQSFSPADYLVVSDIHAMSPDVDVSRFITFVNLNPAKHLVLAGDTLDFYMWRHGGDKRVNLNAGQQLLDFLHQLANDGVTITLIPGNHDLDWAWLNQSAKVPKRYRTAGYPTDMRPQLEALLELPNVHVTNKVEIDNTLVIHGHEGWQGDWLWRISELGDRATNYKLVGRQFRRKVMSGQKIRFMAVEGHGFYRRLASWATKLGKTHVIHGHTHCEGTRTRGSVTLSCLPAWRMSEGPGGGMSYTAGEWKRLNPPT